MAQSFHADIVTPFATENSLPLIVACEPYAAGEAAAPYRSPHEVSIVFPGAFEIAREGSRSTLAVTADRELVVAARMVDIMTFFESGYTAYSVSFIFDGARRTCRSTCRCC